MKIKPTYLLFLLTLSIGFFKQAFASLNEGKELFDDGDYSEAAVELFKVYSKKSYKKDRTKAEWLLAESFDNLSLYYSSSMFYGRIIRKEVGRQPILWEGYSPIEGYR